MTENAEQKYCNFKLLIADQKLTSPLVSLFLQVPFSTFIASFGEKVKGGITKKEAVEQALNLIGAKKTDFATESYKKFGQYISYWIGYVKIMG